MQHHGHTIELVYYGDADPPVSVTIECLTCNIVLIAFEDLESEAEVQINWDEVGPVLLTALRNVTATYRTFRNVPIDEQEWTPMDDEAIDAAFEAIAKAEAQQ